jgi:hypothetical protein
MNPSSCKDNGHDWESVCTIDTELVDGKLYGIVLSECVKCGQEITWMGEKIREKEELEGAGNKYPETYLEY